MSRQYESSTPPEGTSQESSPSRPPSRSRSSHAEQRYDPTPSGQSSPAQSPPPGKSSSSEGYPSWLPKRPAPPGPRSTLQSSVAGMYAEPGPSNATYVIGRKPTPRSVRILSMQGSAQASDSRRGREPTDASRGLSSAAHARVWSRGSAGMSPTLFSAFPGYVPRPRLRTTGLNLELLRSPSWWMRLFFVLFPLFTLLHIPLQTFFDFNAVYILILVAMHPNPVAPGVPGSGSNWALGAAAYIACWFVWIFVVFIVYELLYSFYRRWRVKRPLIFPIYLSSPAFNYAAMSSYTNFCFMYHIRSSVLHGETRSIRDAIAETCYFYSQNWPTVGLLVPRAGLSLALLLTFSSVQADYLAQTGAGISPRDGTFFRADGALTDYARGVLIANAAWTAWRILILLLSLTGLWITSGLGCAGICGPRFRWEEEDAEKTLSAFSGEEAADTDAMPWRWKGYTLLRIKDACDLCNTLRAPRPKDVPPGSREGSLPFEGMERVMAAVGLPAGQQQARRPMLSEDLFDSPPPTGEEFEEKQPEAGPSGVAQTETESPSEGSSPVAGPSGTYPFTARGAQISSEDVAPVPFPPSPEPDDDEEIEVPIEGGEEEEEEGEEEDEEGEEEGTEEVSEGQSQSQPRTSASMSSLGHPIPSRYPFQLRRPQQRPSMSSGSRMTQTHSLPSSQQSISSPHSRSTQSRSTRASRSTQSTGNRESSDLSNGSFSPASPASPRASIGSTGSGIPMPPRHPHVRGRQRAGTIPVPAMPASAGSPTLASFSSSSDARMRAQSAGSTSPGLTTTFGPMPGLPFESDTEGVHEEELMSVPEAEGSVEEAEQHDSVGLLSPGPSPHGSSSNLRRSGSGLSRQRRSRSRSGTGSRSRTNSGQSIAESARSRAQSLIQSLGAASRSSLDLVRSRANSMQRLSDSPHGSTSDGALSSPDNHTFGHPLRERWRSEEAPSRVEPALSSSDIGETTAEMHTATSNLSSAEPSGQPSESSTGAQREGVPTAGRPGPSEQRESQSPPNLSTAPESFVTADPTVQGATTSSSGQSSWNTPDMQHHYM